MRRRLLSLLPLILVSFLAGCLWWASRERLGGLPGLTACLWIALAGMAVGLLLTFIEDRGPA